MKHVSGKLLVRRRWGDGPLRSSLAQITANLNLQHKVCFLGELRNEQVASYYHACDVFALAALTRTEAFGIAQVKAMAAGKPVVNTRLDSGVPFCLPRRHHRNYRASGRS